MWVKKWWPKTEKAMKRKTLPRTSQYQEAGQSGPEATSHLRYGFSSPFPFLGPFENLDRDLSPIKHIYSQAQKFYMYNFRKAINLHNSVSTVFIIFILLVSKGIILLHKACFITLSSMECILHLCEKKWLKYLNTLGGKFLLFGKHFNVWYLISPTIFSPKGIIIWC